MRYTVVWMPLAEAQLARIRMAASDRQTITDAVNRSDHVLATDPEQKGQPIGQLFTYEAAPLTVLYQVDPGDRMVRVFSVCRIN